MLYYYYYLSKKSTTRPLGKFFFIVAILLFGKNETAPIAEADSAKQPQPIRIARSSLPDQSELDFMKQFGYLDSSGILEELQSGDSLMEAIKQVQSFGGINQTGILDENTKRLMKSKRCGVPDVQRKTERFKRYAFGSKGWNKRTITYYISNWSPQLGERGVSSEIQRAFDIWGKYGQLKFKRIYSEKADIIVQFGRLNHGDPFPFDGRGSVLAHAFFPMDATPLGGDIHFDEDEIWSLQPDQSGDSVNFFSVAIHELGHSVGLAHSSEEGSIMNPYYKAADQLGQDDVRAMYELYVSRFLPDDDVSNDKNDRSPAIWPTWPTLPTTTRYFAPTQRTTSTSSYRFDHNHPRRHFPHFNGNDRNNIPPPGRPPFVYPSYPRGENDDDLWRPRLTTKRYYGYTDDIFTTSLNKIPTRPYYIPRIVETTSSITTIKPSSSRTSPAVTRVTTVKPTSRSFANDNDKNTPQLTYHGDDENVMDHIQHDHNRNDENKNSVLIIGCSIHVSAAGIVRNELYFFETKTLWRATEPKSIMSGYPVEFSKFFRTFPEDIEEIDAIYERCTDSNIILFSGNKYFIFDGNRIINSSPRSISEYGLPQTINKIDAVLPLENSITYFFSGDKYFRYNETSNEMEKFGSIQTIFKNIPSDLDAAFLWKNGIIYFFKGTQFWAVDKETFQVKPDNPGEISDYWLNCDTTPAS